MEFVFRDLFSAKVVIPVPLIIELILDKADIVAETKRAIVVHYSVKIIDGLHF